MEATADFLTGFFFHEQLGTCLSCFNIMNVREKSGALFFYIMRPMHSNFDFSQIIIAKVCTCVFFFVHMWDKILIHLDRNYENLYDLTFFDHTKL